MSVVIVEHKFVCVHLPKQENEERLSWKLVPCKSATKPPFWTVREAPLQLMSLYNTIMVSFASLYITFCTYTKNTQRMPLLT